MALRTAHLVADAALPALRRAWQFALARAVQRTEFPRLYNALEAGSVVGAVGAIEWTQIERHLEDTMTPDLLDVMRRAGEAGMVEKRVVAGFNSVSQRMAQAARRQAYDLIQGVTEESKQAIRGLVARMFEQGQTPAQIAKEIRQHIGLTNRDSIALSNFAEELQRRALDPNDPLTVDRAVQMATKYRNQLLAARADSIAKTETMRAANAGQQEAWMQAREQGLTPETAKRQWLITPDERLCPICAPVPAKGPVGIMEPFILGDGTPILSPPAHPRCRCTMSLT